MVVNLQKCLAQGLNPITDVVWVKYSAGKPCMMHILDACLMRRADEHPEYEGYTCGWILGGAGDKVGRKCIPAGSDIPPGMQIIGAWCQAHRKGRKTSPVEALIKDYRKPGEAWGAMSETMIAKVARAQAHRIAFPGPLAGLYSEVEGAQDEGLEVVSEAKELSSRGAEALSGELTTAMFGNDLAPEAEDSEVPPPVEGSAAGPSTPAATPTERGSDTLW
jgi:hypothetical protein